MRYLTAKWYMMGQEYPRSERTERAVREAIESYHQEYARNFGAHEPEFGKARLHDSIVLSSRQEGKDLVLDLEPDLTDITRLVFKDCEILTLEGFVGNKRQGTAVKRASIVKQEDPLKDAWWLDEEIYPSEGGYEIHVLLGKENWRLIEFSVRAREIEIFRDESI